MPAGSREELDPCSPGRWGEGVSPFVVTSCLPYSAFFFPVRMSFVVLFHFALTLPEAWITAGCTLGDARWDPPLASPS